MPAACPGSTLRSSAAPTAANAIARGHGDLALAARSNWITANLRTRLTSLWAAAVPSPQMHPAPVVIRGRLIGPTTRVVHPVAAGAVIGLRVVQERQGLAGEAVHHTGRVGLAGGDDEHPGHVVGAVAVLATGFGQAGVLEGGAVVRHAQQMREQRFGRSAGHVSANRAATSRCARPT